MAAKHDDAFASTKDIMPNLPQPRMFLNPSESPCADIQATPWDPPRGAVCRGNGAVAIMTSGAGGRTIT